MRCPAPQQRRPQEVPRRSRAPRRLAPRPGRGLPKGAGQIAVAPSGDPDRIAFEVDRIDTSAPGRLEIHGRWFGVRGRRFVRPALIVTTPRGVQRRVLADLDGKPWAAQDDEPWQAAFAVEDPLDENHSLELSVSPDINVVLRGDTAPGDGRSVAHAAASPRAKADAPRRRPGARAQDTERLSTRLAAVQAALERERERRTDAEASLERQRGESRRLSAVLGRARAELELARASERAARETSALLDDLRRDLRGTRARHEALVAEHEQTLRAQARLEEELRARSGELESARDGLVADHAALESVRGQAAHTAQVARTARAAREHRPGPEAPTSGPPESARVRAAEGVAHQPVPAGPHNPPPPRSSRPLNPSLSERTNWLGRLLALIVILAFIVAIYLVLHTTVLH